MGTLADTGRLELKFIVSESVAAHVLDVARTHLVPDPMAGGLRQRVTSLYLDTDDLQFLRWHRERADDRFKVRIRRYGEAPAAVLYSEVKRKTQSVVRKLRVPFAPDQLEAIVASHFDSTACRPRVLITAVRESLRRPGTEDAVTVDRALQYQPAESADVLGAPGSWRSVPLPRAGADWVLLELKFGAYAPAWMRSLMDVLTTARVSFSKYAAAMEAEYPPAPSSVRFAAPARLELV